MAVSLLASSLIFLLFQNTGSIQGVVLSTTTTKGVPGAQISIIKTADRPPATAGGLVGGVTGGILTVAEGPSSERLTAVTDGNGRFLLQNLAAGTYIVSASADGYSRQQFGLPPAGQTGMSTPVTLAAGQAAK